MHHHWSSAVPIQISSEWRPNHWSNCFTVQLRLWANVFQWTPQNKVGGWACVRKTVNSVIMFSNPNHVHDKNFIEILECLQQISLEDTFASIKWICLTIVEIFFVYIMWPWIIFFCIRIKFITNAAIPFFHLLRNQRMDQKWIMFFSLQICLQK